MYKIHCMNSISQNKCFIKRLFLIDGIYTVGNDPYSFRMIIPSNTNFIISYAQS